MADRLTLAHAIEDAGAIFDAIHDNVATKVGIQELRREMGLLRADMALLDNHLLTRLGGLIVVLLGLPFAALHAWPPGHGYAMGLRGTSGQNVS